MALPPTIPTSFVPHASGAPVRKFRADFVGAFGFLTYTVLAIVVALALGVFFYGRILAADLSAKDAELNKATEAIDRTTVEGFVRLRNRLNLSGELLKNHVAFSNFFLTIERLLPTNVRFTSIHLALDSTGASKVEGSGVAKSFNALAAASTAFAADGRIKDAIFSKISINRDSSVSFGLSATLDPKLIVFSADTAVSNVTIPITSQIQQETDVSTLPTL